MNKNNYKIIEQYFNQKEFDKDEILDTLDLYETNLDLEYFCLGQEEQ